MTAEVLVAAILGGLLGLLADRLSTRWPIHEDERVRSLDWRTVSVCLAGAAAFAVLAASWGEPRDLAILGLYTGALIVLLATDLDQRLLPDLITLPLIGYAALITILGLNPLLADKPLGLASAVAAAVVTPTLLAVSDRVLKGALGMGDLKLSVSLGLMAGLSQLLVGFLVAATLFAAVVLVLLLARKLSLRTPIPFGPVLIGAGVLAMVVGT